MAEAEKFMTLLGMIEKFPAMGFDEGYAAGMEVGIALAAKVVEGQPIDVWLRFDPADGEEAEAEANTYVEDHGFRIEWNLTAVGQVTEVRLSTYEEVRAWYKANGYQDFTA